MFGRLPSDSDSEDSDQEPKESPDTGFLTGKKKNSSSKKKSLKKFFEKVGRPLGNVRRSLFGRGPSTSPTTPPSPGEFEMERQSRRTSPTSPTLFSEEQHGFTFEPPWQRLRTPSPGRRRPAPPSYPASPATPRRARPKRSSTPSPPIVKGFRKQSTLSPDLEKMRQAFQQLQLSKDELPRELAHRHRLGMREAKSTRSGQQVRKQQLLQRLGPNWRMTVQGGKQRWVNLTAKTNPFTKKLIPQRGTRSEESLFDPRYFRPVSRMGAEPTPSAILPPGRASLGPLPSTGMMRRSYSTADLRDVYKDLRVEEDPTRWNQAQTAFIERLKQMDSEDRKRYRDIRRFTEPRQRENLPALRRLHKPPTIGWMREKDKAYTTSLMGDAQTYAPLPRGARKEALLSRGPLRSALSAEHQLQPMTGISEEGPYRFSEIRNPWTPVPTPTTATVTPSTSSATSSMARERSESLPPFLGEVYYNQPRAPLGGVPPSARASPAPTLPSLHTSSRVGDPFASVPLDQRPGAQRTVRPTAREPFSTLSTSQRSMLGAGSATGSTRASTNPFYSATRTLDRVSSAQPRSGTNPFRQQPQSDWETLFAQQLQQHQFAAQPRPLAPRPQGPRGPSTSSRRSGGTNPFDKFGMR